MRRGVFFIIDAFLAVMLLFVAVIVISTYFVTEEETTQSEFLSRDSVDLLAEVKIKDLDQDSINQITALGSAYKMNYTVLEQIALFWIKNETDAARELSRIIFGNYIPERYGYSVMVGGQMVHSRNISKQTAVRSASHMVSGIEQDKPVEGYTARVYLTTSPYRKVSSYIYFGGFVGEGNLSAEIMLPDNYTNMIEVYFEGVLSTDALLSVNDQYAQTLHRKALSDMDADNYTLSTAVHSLFQPGRNTINITFNVTQANQSLGFIGGGYLRVDTNTTAQFDPRRYDIDNSTQRQYFTGIDGLINIYDSIYVGGDLKQMSLYLHYDSNFSSYNSSNFSIYLNVGNVTVFMDNNVTGEEYVNISDSQLSSKLNYSALSGQTIPIRMGSSGINYSEYDAGNNDVILVTDLSGSMQWRLTSNVNGNIVNDCSDPQIYDSDTRRISLAKCLDKDFVSLILNLSGNRVGLVGFNIDAYTWDSLTTDVSSLISSINNYPDSPSDGTCICCAINRAYNILNSESNASRNKFIIVMSDGIPGRRCIGSGACSTSFKGTSTSGSFCCSGNSGDCNNPSCNGPSKNANWSSWRAHDDLNATVHAIGFGPVSSCYLANFTLNNVAESGDGEYYASSNATELQDIYMGLANNILTYTYKAQAIILTGNLIKSRLFPDSHFELNFTPYVNIESAGDIPLSVELPPFNNNFTNGTFRIPPNITLAEVLVTSYSGDRWTNDVIVFGDTSTVVPYNLSSYGSNYRLLGDPFIVQIPPNYFESGTNVTVRIDTGLSPDNVSGGSPDNRLIFTVLARTNAESEGVGALADGCTWDIRFEDGSALNATIPADYSGNNQCRFFNASYDRDDAIESAAFILFSQLDLDGDGLLDIRFDKQSLNTNVLVTSGVPYLWGPTLVEVRVWQ